MTVQHVIDANHLAGQHAFSLRTFGPGARHLGVLDHIRKELEEIAADPTDLGEWVDVIILALDGAMREGHEPQAVLNTIVAKQRRNEARTWPDSRSADPDKAIEHDRSGENVIGTYLDDEVHPISGRRIRRCVTCDEEAAYCDGSRHTSEVSA